MRKAIAMFDNDFNNNVGNPILLIVTLLMAIFGLHVEMEDAKTFLDIILTYIIKIIPIFTFVLAYLANKDKVDANLKKTLTFKRKKNKH